MYWSKQSDGSCVRYTSTTALPTSAALNSSYPFAAGTTFTSTSSCTTPSNAVGLLGDSPAGNVTISVSYNVIGGIPMICLNSSDTLTFFTPTRQKGTTTEADCVEVVDANGTLGSKAFVSVAYPDGTSVSFKNY